jgi:hypothetical protein
MSGDCEVTSVVRSVVCFGTNDLTIRDRSDLESRLEEVVKLCAEIVNRNCQGRVTNLDEFVVV